MYFQINRAVLLLLLLSTNGLAVEDDDTVSSATEPLHSDQSEKNLALLADIRTQRLQEASQQPEFSVQGTVLDLEPLLKLRQQYLAAQAEQRSASARYQAAELNLARTRNLHQHDIVSTRRLQEQQAQWQNDQALLSTSSYQQQTLLESARLQWGDRITQWFTQAKNEHAGQLLAHRSQLLQISLSSTRHLPNAPQSILVDEQGRRDQAVKAEFVALLPQADPITQGERYLFKLTGRRLPFGTRITAWLPAREQASIGVNIPENAVVWHLGQAYAFIETRPGEFEQRPLQDLVPVDHGYFTMSGLKAGETIVVSGAQTLLSKKLQSFIPDEDDD